jgi:uncharacterized protein YydD (DUF2326 family)
MTELAARHAEVYRDALDQVTSQRDALREVLRKIARGRLDCKRPLPAETVRKVAQEALIRQGVRWGGRHDG